MHKLETILKQIAHQHGITILGQPRLKGLILDMMPTAERKYINVMRRAIDEQIGERLLEMQHDDPSVRQIKINALKEKFKNDNAFDFTAYYIVDCFVDALGWAKFDFEVSSTKTLFNDEEPRQEIGSKEKSEQTAISYGGINMGKQIWERLNLRVGHFRNGDPITYVKNVEEWVRALENHQPAFCIYDDNKYHENLYDFGLLYNWYAVNDPRGLAPSGWHIPSDAEWTELTNFLGGEKNAGIKMIHRFYGPNRVVKDKFQFSAISGGLRNASGLFCHSHGFGYWWTSTDYSPSRAWARQLEFSHNLEMRRYYLPKGSGLSVRCVKD